MSIRRSNPALGKAIIASVLGAALCSGFPAFAADPPGADALLHLTGDTFSRPVAAAADARGNFVMAEANPSADSPTIYSLQLFDAHGAALGSPFAISAISNDTQIGNIAVARNASGAFIVA